MISSQWWGGKNDEPFSQSNKDIPKWKIGSRNFMFSYSCVNFACWSCVPLKIRIGLPLVTQKPADPQALWQTREGEDILVKAETSDATKSKCGDKFLVRHTYRNKCSTKYDPKPYIVVRKTGCMTEVSHGPRPTTRNVSHSYVEAQITQRSTLMLTDIALHQPIFSQRCSLQVQRENDHHGTRNFRVTWTTLCLHNLMYMHSTAN